MLKLILEIRTNVNCKFKNNEKIFYVGGIDDDSFPLEKYEMATALLNNNTIAKDHTGNVFITVQTKDGAINCWYNQNNFISLKDYRKLKLKKLYEPK